MDASRRADEPSRLPAGLTITGELTTDQDLMIEGNYDGQITLTEQHLIIGSTAKVKGRIMAKAVTVAGTLDGTIIATFRVFLQPTASVRGHLQTPSVVITEGATFDGSVDPSRTEAAMHVAKYRQRQA